MKKFTLIDVLAIVIWLVPFVYLFIIYPVLPEQVPLHFDVNGQPDKYGSRQRLLFPLLLINGVAGIMYLLLKFLPAIDPKRKAKYSIGVFKKLGLAMLVFMTLLNVAILYAVENKSFDGRQIIFSLVGLFFAYIGNLFYSVKPNYFVGIRTPWTLESDDNWRETHQLGGKLWLAGGMLMALLSLILPPKAGTITFLAIVCIIILIPVIYSYMYYKKYGVKTS